MRARTGVLAVTLTTLLLPALAWGQTGGTLEKRKEGDYFVEIGEVFLHTDDVPYGLALVDEDGAWGPASFRTVELQTDDLFPVPRISLGLNRPDGKTRIRFTFWDFDEENSTTYNGHVGWSEVRETLGLPGAVFSRVDPIRPTTGTPPLAPYPNAVEDIVASLDREARYVDVSWDRNIHETRRHRFRLTLGARYIEYKESSSTGYLYALETAGLPGSGYLIYNDAQLVEARASSNRLGPKIGIESRFKLGNRFRLVTRGAYSLMEESVVVQYNNFSVDLTGYAVQVSGRRYITLGGRAPASVLNPHEGALNLGIRSQSEHKWVSFADLQVLGEWTIGSTTPSVTMGLGYEAYWWFDVPTSRGAIAGFRDNVDIVSLVRHGEDTPSDPRDDWVEEVVLERNGQRFRNKNIVQREDLLYDGLSFFIRFDF
jgi:hypothetical protein